MASRTEPLRVLFVCTGNSARSQIAEKILNRKAGGVFLAHSAGARPAAQVNPHAIEALERHGYFWTGGHPKSIDTVVDEPWDFVITVCDSARESCPIFPGQPVVAHWGMPDPAAVEGTEQEKRRAFDDVVLTINRRLDLFLALPLDKLSRMALQHRVWEIGQADSNEPAMGTT
jgi:arsenate reductase